MSDTTDMILEAVINHAEDEGLIVMREQLDMVMSTMCASSHGRDLLAALIDAKYEDMRTLSLTRVFLIASGLTEVEAEREIEEGFRYVG